MTTNCVVCDNPACCAIRYLNHPEGNTRQGFCAEHCQGGCSGTCFTCNFYTRLRNRSQQEQVPHQAVPPQGQLVTGPFTFPSRQLHNGQQQTPTSLRSEPVGTSVIWSREIQTALQTLTRIGQETTRAVRGLEEPLPRLQEGEGHGNDRQ